MPKFTYSASKGIEQSSGSGFVINDVSITEGSAAIGDAEAANTYGVNVLAGDATLADGDTAGQKVTVIFGAHPKSLTPANLLGGATVDSAAVGTVAVLLWNGSAWVQVSA